jgi:predicted alpha/beta-hydrolase family hydrolase
MQTKSLTISGYRGEPVSNQFHQQDAESDHLVLVLPGFGYSCDMPVLYFTINHLLDRGADVLQVEYRYNRHAEYLSSGPHERQRWLHADVSAAWRAALDQRTYQRFTVIGKSLGTRAMPQLLANHPLLNGAHTIWFTPVWHEEPVATALRNIAQPTLVVIGTADPLYDDVLATATAANEHCTVTVIPDADHSLEVAGDVIRSVQILENVLVAIQRFTA